MPQLNLQQILNGDTIIQLIDKVNENFNQITTIGGGPQGRRGEQGPPGLPGLRGLIGDSGDNGENAPQVTIVGTDPNWPTLYAGSPLGPTDANVAINLGYAVGDIWIDNTVGLYYVIQETSPGDYEFIPFPISISAVSNDLWVLDTTSNLGVNDPTQGIRNKNRFVTLSLTSIINTSPTNIGDSSSYDDIITNYLNITPKINGYPRKAFKLSLDNTSRNSIGNEFIDRVFDDTDDTSPIHYNAANTSYVPLLYLADASENTADKSAFGLFIKNFGPTLTAGILTLSSSDNILNGIYDQFFIDVPKVGIKNEIYFRGKNNEDSYLRWIDVQNDGTYTDTNNSLWLSIGSQTDPTAPPTDFSNQHFNQFGIELRRYKNPASANISNGGIINFSSFNNTNDLNTTNHTMTISKTGSLLIGNTPPSPVALSINDDDADARLVVWQKNNQDVVKLRASVYSPNMLRLIGPNPTNTWGIGIQGVGIDRFAIRDNASVTERFTILQNGNTGIDKINPTAKLHVGGDAKIETVNNSTGDFLTWNDVGGNAKSVRRRTPTEVRLDIEAVGGSGAATQVAWWNSSNSITGSNNFFWNNNTISLGIGTASPVDGLHINNRDIRLNGGSLREIKVLNARLKISTLNTAPQSGIEISTASPYTEINAPTNTSRLILRGGSVGSDGGIMIYTPDATNCQFIGDILIRPGDNTVFCAANSGRSGIIKLERRVQMVNPNQEDRFVGGGTDAGLTALLGGIGTTSVTIAQATEVRFIRLVNPVATPATNNVGTFTDILNRYDLTALNSSAKGSSAGQDRIITITILGATNTDLIMGHWIGVETKVGANSIFVPVSLDRFNGVAGDRQEFSTSFIVPAGSRYVIGIRSKNTNSTFRYQISSQRFGRIEI